jgi:hypothetical protein
MSRSLFRLLCSAFALVSLTGTLALAQTGSAAAPISGVVIDKDGGVMPGVTVVVKNNGTGVSLPPAVTNADGVFTVASLEPGAYTVTVSLSGFKTVVLNDVKVITATPTNLKVTLEIGQLTEVVNVTANSEVVQTQSTTVSSTIDANQIKNLPLITKNALNYVTFLPGVDTGGTHSQRASTVAGLPQTSLAITIDGVNTQDNFLKSTDGFFSIITPSVDAIEEVTVSSATPGADSSGGGAVQIKFTTRSGTNKFTGSLFEYYRDPWMNANTYFNTLNHLPKNNIVLNQYGGNVGGPIVMPGYNGRNKAFFFVNYEEFRQPSEITRVRTVMTSLPRTGVITYTAAGGATQQVNVLQLAAANGFTSTPDATISGLLSSIASSTQSSGSLTGNTDPNSATYTYNSAAYQTRHFPTMKFDFQLTPNEHLTTTYNFQKFNSNPDTLNSVDARFPGFPAHGSQYSYRNSGSASLRSTLTPNIVNQATYGILWAPVYFFSDMNLGMFSNQNGYSLTLAGGGTGGAFNGLTSATGGNLNGPESRNGWDWNFDDTVSWQHGKHSLQFGENFIQAKSWIRDQQLAPSIGFGVDTTNDPANVLFTNANFPGASNQTLADARYLYALLTGRVTSISGQLAIDGGSGNYVYNGVGERRVHMNEIGLFAQDAYRAKPNLTLNVGLRYELQLPIQAENSVYSSTTMPDACGVSGTGSGFNTQCNVFMPGTLTGRAGVYEQYSAGTQGYHTDYNNLAPSVGVAWQPNARTGVLRGILGDPDQATVRAAYSRAFNREGLSGMSTPYENNPGVFVTQTRNAANGNLVLPGETWPVLFSQASRLGPGAFPTTPSYPIGANRTAGFNLYDPNWQVGYVDSYTIGLQRSLSKDMAVEIRYVGTRGKDGREGENWNETNIVENGFLNEFKLAQANLYANIAAGRGQTIAYEGPGSGTSPLPTYLAYFNGLSAANAGDSRNYTGPNWNNSTIVGRFYQLSPNPQSSAADLLGSSTFRNNALTAGLPANFFVLNPDVNNVTVQVSKAYTKYNALQLDLRKRLSDGLSVDANYTYAVRYASRLDSLRTSRYLVQSTAGVPSALKITGTYDLPIGRGRRYGTNMSSLTDAFAGGWSVNITGKVQSGQVLNFGNVRLVGMTQQDLQKAFKYRFDTTTVPGTTLVHDLPQDIIDNTVKAFNITATGYAIGAPTGRYFAPANGPDCIQVLRGDCAPKDVFVVAPLYTRFDFSAKKTVRTGGTTNFVFEVDVLNLFNAIDFNPTSPGNNNSLGTFNFSNADTYRVTSSYSDVNGTFDPGSRVGQLVFRFS